MLSAAGYFVAAGFFFGRMSYTLFCALAAVMLYGLMALWVNLQRTHLNRRRADEARQALSSDETARDSTEIAPLPMARIDVATIGEQTRALLDMLILLLLLVGLWAVWKGAVPALSVISDYELWHYSATVAGKEVVRPLTVGDLFIVILVGAVTAVVVRNIGALLDIVLLQRLQVQADATYAIKIVSRYIVAALGLGIACGLLGIGWDDVHWLVAALGVGLGFGLQEIFANFVCGLIVLAERPIRIGDVVTVGDVSGTVSRIRARATSVVDFDNKEVIIPNKAFITERVVNWTLSNQTTRLLFEVGVAYGSDVLRVQQLLLDAVQRNPDVLAEPSASAFFVGFGDSALNFEVRVFVGAMDKRLRVRHEVNVAIERVLRENGIESPFPQRDVHIRGAGLGEAPA
jgi:potassium efflux system protein